MRVNSFSTVKHEILDKSNNGNFFYNGCSDVGSLFCFTVYDKLY